MLYVALLAALAMGQRDPLDRTLGDRIDFVERNIINILRHGHFPQLYNSSWKMIRDCGCYYSPQKINFGSQVGMYCHRRFPEENPPYNEDECGMICNSPHGTDIVLWCPHGWDSQCDRGCYPPDTFKSIDERVDFWELTLTSLIMYGHNYIAVAADYLEECGCDGKIRPIRYGTQIGFDCVLKEGQRLKETCGAASMCTDDQGRQIVTFCPAGHTPTCSGCEKTIAEEERASTEIMTRLNWMINVITGYSRESLTLLGWEPSSAQILECACVGAVKPITYGASLGYFCNVNEPKAITEGCGPNILCRDNRGQDLLHFCPDGFTPSCTEGCTYPWKGKEEL